MPTRHRFYRDLVKPFVDRYLAIVALIAAAPLLLLIAVAVRVMLGSPVIYSQTRPGKRGRPFRIYKFRTMTDARNSAGQLLSDGERLTRFGRFLRSTSLDELPELWNVLRGEMSLVGPRPLLTEYLPSYTRSQSRRHEVLPGLTGLAQVSGRNALSWDEKFDRDLEYVDTLSLGLDFKILTLTFVRVFRREGISAASHSTMPVFTGTESRQPLELRRAA